MRALTLTARGRAVPLLRWLTSANTSRNPWIVVVRGTFILAFIALLAAFVYGAGGTRTVYPHLFYLPVILAAFYFGIPGALVAGILAGLATGPLMPLDRATGIDQQTLPWMYRLSLFTAVGVFTGALLESRSRLQAQVRGTAGELYVAYGKCLTTFASLVSLRDEPTAHHCERVAENAVTVGREIGLPEQQIKELYWEGILHDLGKVATPAHILLKPGSLTHAEYDEIKKHAKLGADILSSISPRFKNLADGVRSHHEHWDGSGYPDRLAGEEIPLNGRILAVVDVFEAMTSDRPYRKAMSVEDAIDIIREESGRQFDPAIASLFLDLCAQGRILVQGDPVPGVDQKEYPVPGYAVLQQDAA